MFLEPLLIIAQQGKNPSIFQSLKGYTVAHLYSRIRLGGGEERTMETPNPMHIGKCIALNEGGETQKAAGWLLRFHL